MSIEITADVRDKVRKFVFGYNALVQSNKNVRTFSFGGKLETNKLLLFYDAWKNGRIIKVDATINAPTKRRASSRMHYKSFDRDISMARTYAAIDSNRNLFLCRPRSNYEEEEEAAALFSSMYYSRVSLPDPLRSKEIDISEWSDIVELVRFFYLSDGSTAPLLSKYHAIPQLSFLKPVSFDYVTDMQHRYNHENKSSSSNGGKPLAEADKKMIQDDYESSWVILIAYLNAALRRTSGTAPRMHIDTRILREDAWKGIDPYGKSEMLSSKNRSPYTLRDVPVDMDSAGRSRKNITLLQAGGLNRNTDRSSMAVLICPYPTAAGNIDDIKQIDAGIGDSKQFKVFVPKKCPDELDELLRFLDHTKLKLNQARSAAVSAIVAANPDAATPNNNRISNRGNTITHLLIEQICTIESSFIGRLNGSDIILDRRVINALMNIVSAPLSLSCAPAAAVDPAGRNNPQQHCKSIIDSLLTFGVNGGVSTVCRIRLDLIRNPNDKLLRTPVKIQIPIPRDPDSKTTCTSSIIASTKIQLVSIAYVINPRLEVSEHLDFLESARRTVIRREDMLCFIPRKYLADVRASRSRGEYLRSVLPIVLIHNRRRVKRDLDADVNAWKHLRAEGQLPVRSTPSGGTHLTSSWYLFADHPLLYAFRQYPHCLISFAPCRLYTNVEVKDELSSGFGSFVKPLSALQEIYFTSGMGYFMSHGMRCYAKRILNDMYRESRNNEESRKSMLKLSIDLNIDGNPLMDARVRDLFASVYNNNTAGDSKSDSGSGNDFLGRVRRLATLLPNVSQFPLLLDMLLESNILDHKTSITLTADSGGVGRGGILKIPVRYWRRNVVTNEGDTTNRSLRLLCLDDIVEDAHREHLLRDPKTAGAFESKTNTFHGIKSVIDVIILSNKNKKSDAELLGVLKRINATFIQNNSVRVPHPNRVLDLNDPTLSGIYVQFLEHNSGALYRIKILFQQIVFLGTFFVMSKPFWGDTTALNRVLRYVEPRQQLSSYRARTKSRRYFMDNGILYLSEEIRSYTGFEDHGVFPVRTVEEFNYVRDKVQAIYREISRSKHALHEYEMQYRMRIAARLVL